MAAPSLTITLSPNEWFYACQVGVSRQIDNLRARRIDRYGASEADGWKLHIEGACGEMAVAKHLGLYWSGNLGNLHAADVASLQVRTRSKHEYELILHPHDKDEDVFILVTGLAPSFDLRGWVYGHEGKQQTNWRDPAGGRAAFFVPTDQLRAIASLGRRAVSAVA